MIEPARRSLTVAGVTLAWRPTPWDARCLEVPTVELLEATAGAEAAALAAAVAALDAAWDADGIGLASTRIAQADAPLVAALAAVGFAHVETSHALHLALAARDPRAAFGRAVAIEPAAAGDRDALVALARDGFDFSRFHEDARIHPSRARDRYARWIADSLDDSLAGGREAVWLHRHRGEVLALMSFVRTGPGAVQLHLGGARPGANLIAPMFWTGVLAALRAEGVATVDTRVSAANGAALRLHAAFGFAITSTDLGLTKIYPSAAGVLASEPSGRAVASPPLG